MGKDARIILGNFTGISRMSAVTAHDVSDSISSALRRAVGNARHAAKTIAGKVKAQPRTVESWLSGETAPRAAELIRLMGEYDEVWDVVREMAGRNGDGLTDKQRQALAALRPLLEG